MQTNKCDFSLIFYRKMYSPRCRHIQYGWLVDSIVDKCLAAVTNYPVFMPSDDD